ncbi:hypothetical protein ACIBIZ_31610 [Nonomuraea spiralis]|uniref:hypothetical protein n=1 Tax=Nonomuraea spiralis TaxID=46182 RepID=UPI003791CDF5
MSTISHAPYLLVVVAAVFCALVHRRVAARNGPRAKIVVAMNAPRPLLGDLLALAKPAVFWLAALWAAHALLPFPAAGEPPVTAVLLTVGLVVGVAGVAPLIAASSLLFGPILADTGYTLALVVPMIAGSLLLFALVRPERWRGDVAQLRVLATYGSIHPRGPSQYVLAGLGVAAAAVPLVATALVPADLGPTGTALRWLCSALVAVQLLSWQRSLRREHRWSRSYANLYLAVSVAAGFAAATVLGAEVVRAWVRHDWLTGWIGGLVLTVAALLTWVLTKGEPATFLVEAPLRVVRAALTSAVFPCFAGVCLFPSTGTVVATTILAAAETVTLVAGRRRLLVRAMSRRTLAHVARFAPGNRVYFLGPWLHDSIWIRPARPDLTLVRAYTGMAAGAAGGEMIPGQAVLATNTDLRRPLAGVKALLWTTLATEALDQVDREVAPRVPADAVPGLRAALEAARADVDLARAVVHSTEDQWPQVPAALRGAAERYQRVGAPHRAALAVALAAVVSAVHLAQPQAAERSLDAVPGPVADIPPIRGLGLILRAQLAPADSEERAALLAQADAVPFEWASLTGGAARDAGLPAWDDDLTEGVLGLCRRLRGALTVAPRFTMVEGGGAIHDETLIRVV